MQLNSLCTLATLTSYSQSDLPDIHICYTGINSDPQWLHKLPLRTFRPVRYLTGRFCFTVIEVMDLAKVLQFWFCIRHQYLKEES